MDSLTSCSIADKFTIVSWLLLTKQSSLCCLSYFKGQAMSQFIYCLSIFLFLQFLLFFLIKVFSQCFSSHGPLLFFLLIFMKEHKSLNPATCLQYHAFRWIFLVKQKQHYVLLMSLVQRYQNQIVWSIMSKLKFTILHVEVLLHITQCSSGFHCFLQELK